MTVNFVDLNSYKTKKLVPNNVDLNSYKTKKLVPNIAVLPPISYVDNILSVTDVRFDARDLNTMRFVNLEGTGSFSGKTIDTDNNIIPCELVLILSYSNEIITTTFSDNNGEFKFEYLNEDLYYDIIARPLAAGTYERKIVSNKKPSPQSSFNTIFTTYLLSKSFFSQVDFVVKIDNIKTAFDNVSFSLSNAPTGLYVEPKSNGNDIYARIYSNSILPDGDYSVLLNVNDVDANITRTTTVTFKVVAASGYRFFSTPDNSYINEKGEVVGNLNENNGSSVFYNGSLVLRDNRYLTQTIPINLDKDFTISGLFTVDSLDRWYVILGNGLQTYNNNDMFFIGVAHPEDGSARRLVYGARNVRIASNTIIQPFRKYHFSIVSANGYVEMYLNNVLNGGAAIAQPGNLIQPIHIGTDGWATSTESFSGLLKDISIVNGAAIKNYYREPPYAMEYMYPIVEHTFNSMYDDKFILWNGINSTITTHDNKQCVELQAGCIYNTVINDHYVLGTGDFTIELEYMLTTDTQTGKVLLDYSTASQSGSWQLWILESKLRLFINGADNGLGITIPENEWVHFKFIRYNGNFVIVINDQVKYYSNQYNRSLDYKTSYFAVGGQYTNRSPQSDMTGYISKLKVIKGYADHGGL